jgi:predicted dehydrogenase
MSDSDLRAIVVGTGFGCRVQVPALRAAGFEIVGLVGTDEGRTRERATANGVANAFTDLDTAITQTSATAVAIASPPHEHARLTLAAIARGCHVLCEKPFAKTAEEGRAMLDAAERAGIVHMVGHEFRWLPERAMLARLLAEGVIGEPRLAIFTSLTPYLVDPNIDMPGWWFDEEAGGGWLGAAGSHGIDWIRTLFGEFESVSATLQSLRPSAAGADDTFLYRFHLANGVEGVVQDSAAAWGPPMEIVRIQASKGALWLQGNQIWIADDQGSRTVPIAESFALPQPPPPSSDPRQQTAKWQMLTQIELAPYLRLGQAFRARIEGRDPPHEPAVPTFADGLASIEVLDAIRKSAAAGGELIRLRG